MVSDHSQASVQPCSGAFIYNTANPFLVEVQLQIPYLFGRYSIFSTLVILYDALRYVLRLLH